MEVEMKADFSTLIMSLGSSALIGLGLAENPSTGQIEKDLKMAEFNIDLLKILQTKTDGNLTKEEADFLKNILADLQMQYVNAK
jgi:hypothetical protein